MTSRDELSSTLGRESAGRERRIARRKRPYREPRFEVIGDVRDITLSPSPGRFESGGGIGFRG